IIPPRYKSREITITCTKKVMDTKPIPIMTNPFPTRTLPQPNTKASSAAIMPFLMLHMILTLIQIYIH
ncbi:MAG: hypothetical protein ACREOB_06950, partial [Thermodesulfobacteriota bacterium]